MEDGFCPNAMELAYEHALSAIGTLLPQRSFAWTVDGSFSRAAAGETSSDEVDYNETGSTFDAFYGEGAIRSTDDTLPTLWELRETDIFADRSFINVFAFSVHA